MTPQDDEAAPSAPATNWAETIAADEPERFARYATAFQAMQQRKARKGKPWRALHAKGIGLEAEFSVLPQLPDCARVGLFAAPATYRAYVRFSNGAAAPQSDRKPDIRGFAIKLVGLENGATQDFLANRGTVTPFRNADEFVHFIMAAERPILLLPKLFWHFGFFGALRVLGKLVQTLKEPALPLSAIRFDSEIPIRFGDYAVRYAVMPTADEISQPLDKSQADHLRTGLAEQLRQGPVHYDFCIQFFRDEIHTPIEDGSLDWLEQHAPYITVARLTLKQQDMATARGQRISDFVEKLSFNVWNAPDDFRPLGSMMRVRHAVYRASSKGRSGAAEPDGRESFD